MRFASILAVTLLAAAPVARAQQVVEIRVIQLDPGFLCPAPGLPAMSPDGHRIALVRCWSDLSDARDVELEILAVPSGRVQQRIPLLHAGTGGAHPTPEATVARNVERANHALAAGRFEPLQELASPDVPLADTSGAGITVRYVIEGHVVVVEGVATAHADVAGWPARGACCAAEEGSPASCSLTPVIRGAWVDPAAHFLLVGLATDSVPHGCEHGPEYKVIALRHPNDRH